VGHAAYDTWFGLAPLMLAALSGPMALSNADIGLILLLYQATSSLAQPFFGRITERIGGRPLAVGSILWTTALFSASLFTNNKWLLATCIGLSGLGSAAWHPQGAANATLAGGSSRGATAASVFFLGGTLGASLLGAFAGGQLLSAFGRPSLLIIAFVTVVLALMVVRPLVPLRVPTRPAKPRAAGEAPLLADRRLVVVIVLFLVCTALRALTYHSLNSYIPKLQEDHGISTSSYSALMSAYMVAQAIGGVLGSYLSDRIDLRTILAASLALAALLLIPALWLPGLPGQVLLVISGLFFGPSQILLVVAGQKRFPEHMVVVSGLLMGFTFISGSGGAWLLGLLADSRGLEAVLRVLPLGLMGAAVLAWLSLAGEETLSARR
jgi:FSR family fosmidomycin resistance protein-like MFS transporter